MERANQGGGTGFWWRAAEPIPARPLPLELPPGDEFVPAPPIAAPTAPAHRHAAHAATDVRPSPPRPVASSAASPTPATKPPLRFGAPARRRTKTGDFKTGGIGAKPMALAAAVAGALVFAGLSGFGTRVRGAPPLLAQIESWAIASGFGINEISVAGLKHTSDSDVFRALGSHTTTLAGLDVAAARGRIEALPWVETATLVRILPDKLRIEVQERRASAVWLQGERKSLVDANGRLLGHLGNFVPPDLPRIAGDGAPEAAAQLFAALSQHVGLRSQVVLARRIGQRRWDLEMASGTRVKLAATDLEASLVRLVSLQQQSPPSEAGLLDRANQIIDLTLDDRVAIGAEAAERNGDRQAAVGSDPAQPL